MAAEASSPSRSKSWISENFLFEPEDLDATSALDFEDNGTMELFSILTEGEAEGFF